MKVIFTKYCLCTYIYKGSLYTEYTWTIFGVDIYNRKAAFIRKFLLLNILEYPVKICVIDTLSVAL